MGMQRSFHIHLLPTLRSTFDDFQISCNSLPLLVVHVSGSSVADPGVSTSSTGVDPHDVLKPKVVPQSYIDYFDRHGDEAPTFVADVRLVAARSNLVIVRQIDVKDQLLRQRPKCRRLAQCFAISRISSVDRSDFKSGGI